MGCPCQADAALLSQGAREDAACLCMRAMEEQSQGFTACLSQKAMVEQIGSLVEDSMGEEEGDNTRVLLKREEQPTHHSKSCVFDKAYRGNVIKVTVVEGKDNARDVVKKGQEEEAKKEKNLQMVHAAHLSTPSPSGVLDCCCL